MYQSVLTNNRFTNPKMVEKYQEEFRKMGDIVLANLKFGFSNRVDKARFIRIKHLIPVISDEFYSDTFINGLQLDTLLNKFNSILIN